MGLGLKTKNVLVVDDDSSIRKLIRIALQLEDDVAEVREAQNGADALDVCADFEPDVIVLDYWMPNMNGRDAARRMREIHPGAFIIVFSGVVEEKPDWADAHFMKGRNTDFDRLIDLTRA